MKVRDMHDQVIDDELKPVAIGSREEVLNWIDLRISSRKQDFSVLLGETPQVISVQDYIDQNY